MDWMDAKRSVTHLGFALAPFCYPPAPEPVPATYLPPTDVNIDLYFEALRRAMAAHDRPYCKHLWRQVIMCAVVLFDLEEAMEEAARLKEEEGEE